MFEYNMWKKELPESAYKKKGGPICDDVYHEDAENPTSEILDNMIVNSERYVPMGVQIKAGSATAIVIFTGNLTLKALFQYQSQLLSKGI